MKLQYTLLILISRFCEFSDVEGDCEGECGGEG